MEPVHRTLLEMNEEFLVSETPAEQLVDVLHRRGVLNSLDVQQISVLEPQGSRAVKRFVLHVLPDRGPGAFRGLLEALQEVRAQHVADLLVEGEAQLRSQGNIAGDQALPGGQARNPHENVRRLRANKALIERSVDPEHVIPMLRQQGVFVPLEESLLADVKGQNSLTWSVLWGVLMQRGPKAYHAFMGALLQNGYSSVFRAVEETRVWA